MGFLIHLGPQLSLVLDFRIGLTPSPDPTRSLSFPEFWSFAQRLCHQLSLNTCHVLDLLQCGFNLLKHPSGEKVLTLKEFVTLVLSSPRIIPQSRQAYGAG